MNRNFSLITFIGVNRKYNWFLRCRHYTVAIVCSVKLDYWLPASVFVCPKSIMMHLYLFGAMRKRWSSCIVLSGLTKWNKSAVYDTIWRERKELPIKFEDRFWVKISYLLNWMPSDHFFEVVTGNLRKKTLKI
jgi:hypothetical protein